MKYHKKLRYKRRGAKRRSASTPTAPRIVCHFQPLKKATVIIRLSDPGLKKAPEVIRARDFLQERTVARRQLLPLPAPALPFFHLFCWPTPDQTKQWDQAQSSEWNRFMGLYLKAAVCMVLTTAALIGFLLTPGADEAQLWVRVMFKSAPWMSFVWITVGVILDSFDRMRQVRRPDPFYTVVAAI
ncbi:MAG: hypothetical protein RJB39_787 [Candidatus Parcubacteria bacterium]|jgi:hypothetical protein